MKARWHRTRARGRMASFHLGGFHQASSALPCLPAPFPAGLPPASAGAAALQWPSCFLAPHKLKCSLLFSESSLLLQKIWSQGASTFGSWTLGQPLVDLHAISGLRLLPLSQLGLSWTQLWGRRVLQQANGRWAAHQL